MNLVSVRPGHEGVVYALPVLSGGLLLPERPFQPQLQRGHEPPDTQPQHQPYAGRLHTCKYTQTLTKQSLTLCSPSPQGQAQECLLEKSMLDNRKSFLVARISAQVDFAPLEAV